MKVQQIGILFLWMVLTISCTSKNTKRAVIKDNETAFRKVDSSLFINEVLQQQLLGLETYVKATSFSAVITNIQIETTTEDYEDHHIIKANLVELFKGEANQFIEFEMFTESGELVRFAEQVLICLCQKEEKLYWAGTGSVFPATQIFINKALEMAENFKGSDELFCED